MIAAKCHTDYCFLSVIATDASSVTTDANDTNKKGNSLAQYCDKVKLRKSIIAQTVVVCLSK